MSEANLRKALEDLLNMYVANVNSGDWGYWNPEEDPEVIAARKALAEPQEIPEYVDQPLPGCGKCHACLKDHMTGAFPTVLTRMLVCTYCGSKRCPKAADHTNLCTDISMRGHWQ